MSRRRAAKPRDILPDVRYGSLMIAKFVNKMMIGGKKSIAEKHFYTALESAAKKAKEEELELFQKVVDSVKPDIEVRSRRVGGATYQVPVEVRTVRAVTLAMRWILAAAKARRGRSFSDKLAAELLDALNGTGAARKRRDEMERMAESNRAYAHLRV